MPDSEERPLWVLIEQSIDVEHRRFSLIEDEADLLEALQADGPDDTVVAVGHGWLALLSGGSVHTPTLALEAWESEPPEDDETWAERRDVMVTFPSRVLGTWVVGGPSFARMYLPPQPESTYGVRVRRRGGGPDQSVEDLVLQAVEDGWTGDEPLRLEEWRIPFPPAS